MSRETKRTLFYHAKPHHHGFHCEAWRGKTKLFWSPGIIWPPCKKGEFSDYTIVVRLNGCAIDKMIRNIELRYVRQNLRDGIGVFSPFCMGEGEGVDSCFKQGRCVKMRKTELEGWYRCFQSFLHGGRGGGC